jgi:hypothetical protein
MERDDSARGLTSHRIQRTMDGALDLWLYLLSKDFRVSRKAPPARGVRHNTTRHLFTTPLHPLNYNALLPSFLLFIGFSLPLIL